MMIFVSRTRPEETLFVPDWSYSFYFSHHHHCFCSKELILALLCTFFFFFFFNCQNEYSWKVMLLLDKFTYFVTLYDHNIVCLSVDIFICIKKGWRIIFKLHCLCQSYKPDLALLWITKNAKPSITPWIVWNIMWLMVQTWVLRWL